MWQHLPSTLFTERQTWRSTNQTRPSQNMYKQNVSCLAEPPHQIQGGAFSQMPTSPRCPRSAIHPRKTTNLVSTKRTGACFVRCLIKVASWAKVGQKMRFRICYPNHPKKVVQDLKLHRRKLLVKRPCSLWEKPLFVKSASTIRDHALLAKGQGGGWQLPLSSQERTIKTQCLWLSSIR